MIRRSIVDIVAVLRYKGLKLKKHGGTFVMEPKDKVCLEEKTEKKWSRAAGVLMPISSLPNAYGIGTLGKEAYEFADFAKKAGFSYWQVLPVGPTSYGDSPYQGFSAFAGNPYFIDLEALVDEGLLDNGDLAACNWGMDPTKVDYGAIYENRFPILRKAFERSRYYLEEEYAEFCKENEYWLEDYALFMAVKKEFGFRSWQEWDKDIRCHEEVAVKAYLEKCEEEVEFYKFCQYKFDTQWKKLRKYVNELGIEMIGDIPLYVAMDSADVWVHSDVFELDIDRQEVNIAGVPPDLFSATGQRWGNPLYRWDVMEEDNFTWWRNRMFFSAKKYDVIRIDHFIGVVNYYSIPAECPTAIDGKWKKGPGEKLTKVIAEATKGAKIIAEDLGVLTAPVVELMQKNGYPGMKVLEFGLDLAPDNAFLPHNYMDPNTIAYIGTHDNETLVGCLQNKSWDEMTRIKEYFNVEDDKKLVPAMIRSVYACTANTAIFQMQDLLGLGNDARMNFPSTLGANWAWRMTAEQYTKVDINYYKRLAYLYNRLPQENKKSI